MAILTKEELIKLIKVEKKTHKEISHIYKIDRTYISHLLKKYGININNEYLKYTREFCNKLDQLKISYVNLKEKDLTSLYAFEINGKRVSFLTARKPDKKGNFYFSLSDQSKNGKKESEYSKKINEYRILREYKNISDIIVFACIQENETNYFIIETKEISKIKRTVSLNPKNVNSKYNKFMNNFSYLLV